MVNLKDKVKKLTVIYICFFAICALFYFVAGDQIQTKRSVSPQIVPDGIVPLPMLDIFRYPLP